MAIKNESISFECIFCEAKLQAPLGRTNNILTHLRFNCSNRDYDQREQLKKWLFLNDAATTDPHNKTKISTELLNLVKFFISSNIAASCFDNPYFRALFHSYTTKIPTAKTFSNGILTDVYKQVI